MLTSFQRPNKKTMVYLQNFHVARAFSVGRSFPRAFGLSAIQQFKLYHGALPKSTFIVITITSIFKIKIKNKQNMQIK